MAQLSVPPGERIAPIDILRGVALFGVMAVNVVTAFRVSMFQQFLPGFEPVSFPDRIAEFLVSQVLELKAFALFSLLFGVGLGIQFDRLSAGGRPLYWLARRMIVLLAFGLIHLLLIWNGDILAEYAVAGFLVLPFLRAPRAVIRWISFGALCFYVVMPLMPLPIPWPDAATLRDQVDAANRVYATGGYAEILKFSLGELRLLAPLHEYIFPRTVGLFLLGVLAWRSGFLEALGRHKPQLVIGTVLGLGAGAVLTGMGGAGERLGTILLALGYACLVLWMTQMPQFARALAVFAPLGKMAFTNYLLQSLVFGALFFGWGFGLFGKLSAMQALMVGTAVYAAQACASAWWLERFLYGPLEWTWRTLMYGEAPAMRVRTQPGGGR